MANSSIAKGYGAYRGRGLRSAGLPSPPRPASASRAAMKPAAVISGGGYGALASKLSLRARAQVTDVRPADYLPVNFFKIGSSLICPNRGFRWPANELSVEVGCPSKEWKKSW